MALSFINDEASLFNFVVKDGNGIKGLVDLGLTEVPALYIQPSDKRIIKQHVEAGSVESMIIDLSELDSPNHDQVVKAMSHAAETLGFFQVVNHGVPLELLESTKVAVHQFFNQPAEKKCVNLNGMGPSPMVIYGTSFNPEKEKVLEWKDYISMTYTNDTDALQFWPNQFKEVLLDYVKTSRVMMKKVLQALIRNLEVKLEESRLDELISRSTATMNIYPRCPNPGLTVGVSNHSDGDILTVLLQDGIGGLSIKNSENGEWIEIPSIDGALIINVGDLLQILSNGRYISAEHRVRTTSIDSRVSVAMFTTPSPSVKIGPIPEVVARDGVARYREVTFGEYKAHVVAKTLDGKKSLEFVSI